MNSPLLPSHKITCVVFLAALTGALSAADNFADAEDTPFNSWVTESNTSATSEAAEPPGIGYLTIWRKFTTTQRCIVTVKTPDAPPIDTTYHLTVFRGTGYESLNLIKSIENNEGDSISIPAEKGMTFRVCMGSYWRDRPADMTFAVLQSTWPYGGQNVVPPPEPTNQIVPNDSIETARAIPFPSVPATVFGYLGSATTQPIEGDATTGVYAVWHSWKAPYDGKLRITSASIPNTEDRWHRVTVYTGDPSSPLVQISTQTAYSFEHIDLTVPIRSNITCWIAVGLEKTDLRDYSYILEFQPWKFSPEIEIITPGGRGLVDGTSKIDFGTVKVGKTGATQTLFVVNKGNGPLAGLSTRKSGLSSADFIVKKITPATIAPGATGTLKIRFKPRKKGSRSAKLRIYSNDADESPFDLKLSGKGKK